MAFTYDPVGNRLIGPAYPKASAFQQSYTYDYENRIVSATKQVTGNPNADTITFKYDPFGRRIEKNVSTFENGIPTTYKYIYVYDNEDIILEVLERTQNGNTTTTTTAYTHGPGVDEPLSLTRGGQTYYYHADGLGSITSLTDSSEAVVNRYAYDSFGAPKSSETIRNAYTYTGREYDSETGLYYYRARYYDPEAGRFVSKDPIGFAGRQVNLYGYVFASPVNWLDPWGLIAQCPKTPPLNDPSWLEYKKIKGRTEAFHCGYDTYIENRYPSVEDPQAECVYDEKSTFVDGKHEYAGCRGTANEYDSHNDVLKHIFIDSGGIFKNPNSFTESIRKGIIDRTSQGIEGGFLSLY
jgi:RHS repeat-associated protein